MRRRTTLIAAGAALLAVAVGLMLTIRQPRGPAEGPAIGGPFTLTDGDGHRRTQASFDGLWRLVYFGYTHCPDVCPTTLSNLAAAIGKLPPAAQARLRVLFVTVDPARDTPAVIGAYAHAFGPEFIGLTGTAAELDRMASLYHVYARRHDLPGGDYAMDHSSIIYVMAPDGHFTGLLDDAMSPAELAAHLLQAGA